jgi:hypothetical protein
MKTFNILFSLTTLFYCSTSFAARPEIDPTVKSVREMFRTAKVPSREDFRIGQPWYCVVFKTTGEEKVHEIKPRLALKFGEFNGLIYNAVEFDHLKLSPVTGEFEKYIIAESDIWDALDYLFIRVLPNGNLVTEDASIHSFVDSTTHSLVRPELLTGGYSICQTNL